MVTKSKRKIFAIDGVQKKATVIVKKSVPHIAIPARVREQPAVAPVFKIPSPITEYHFWQKQKFTIPTAIVITFFISLAASQSIASYNNTQNNEAPIIPIAQNNGSKSTLTLASSQNPTLTDHILNNPNEIYLAAEDIQVPDPLKERKEFLVKYLTAKHSILADHVDAISEQSQWKLIIAISRAESSFCKRHAVNNCWGIGGAWDLKNYTNLDEAIVDVNRILEQHYIQAGLDTPDKIVNKWVGHPNDNWEAAVQQELDNLKNVQ